MDEHVLIDQATWERSKELFTEVGMGQSVQLRSLVSSINYEILLCRSMDCPAGRIAADAFLACCKTCDAALVNGGAVRTSLAAGPLSMRNARAVFAFENDIILMKLTGRDLKVAMRHGL